MLSNVLPEAERNVSLKSWNSLGVEAIARTLYRIRRPEQIEALVRENRLGEKALILGGGSNVLLKDPLPDPVIRMEIPGIESVKESKGERQIRAGAGVVWHELVQWAVNHQLGGIEALALIPGTVGAAPVQNIGAYGVELADRMVSLDAYDRKEKRWVSLQPDQCEFGYRESLFKGRGRGRYLITSVTLRLTGEGYRPSVRYQAVQDWLETNKVPDPTMEDLFRAVVSIRQSKLPDPRETGNAGSFFKNPVISRTRWEELCSQEGEIPFYPVDEQHVKIPAAWLIDRAGLKGARQGAVGTWPGQPLVLVNYGGATAEELLAFSRHIQRTVADRFGVELEREVTLMTRNGA